MKRLLSIATLLVAMPLTLGAQIPAGDAAWKDGRYADARAAYLRVLGVDSLNTRANLRLGVLLSWDNKLDSAIALISRGRRADPTDNDAQVAEARIRSWAAQYDLAVAEYDSVLARDSLRRDAALGKALTLAWANRFNEADAAYKVLLARDPADTSALAGRAQVAAWHGDFPTARARYLELLNADPRNADALVGLAQLDHWEGHDRAALHEVDSAIALAPGHPQARKLERDVRAAVRPQVDLTFGWGLDSDQNETWWETAVVSTLLGDGLRGFGSAGLFQASDAVNNAHRTSAEVGGSLVRNAFRATVAAGARSLSPEGLADRTVGTVRASAGYRLSPAVSAGLGYSYAPFDETAGLIARGLDVGALDGSADIHAADRLDLSFGAGLAWLSDGNSRTSAVGALTRTLPRHFFVGALARVLDYDHAGVGYFSPTPFTTYEARGGWDRGEVPWGVRVSGGLGVQQVSGGATQAEWHGELRLERRWGVVNDLAVFGGITNSAAASTTGAFRYGTAGISLRLGL